MTKEEKIAYLNSQVVCAEIELVSLKIDAFLTQGDKTELRKVQRKLDGLAFEFGIDQNFVLEFFH